MTEKLFYKDSHLSKFDAEVLSCVRAKRQQVKDSFGRLDGKAEDFCTGAIEELTTPSLAAMGKLELEAKDLSLTGALRDWTDFIEQLCLEDEEMAFAVRRKGKSLKDCMALILKNAFNDKAQLDDRITKAAGLTPPLYISIPGKAQIKEIVRKYYLGEKK